MPSIILRQSAIDKLNSDPKIKQWLQHKSGRDVPLLGWYRLSYSTSRDETVRMPCLRYYRRSYSTAHHGTVTEHGDGFSLTTIDPTDAKETEGIGIKSVAVANGFDILVGGDDSIMAGSFMIGWLKKFTYEPLAPS